MTMKGEAVPPEGLDHIKSLQQWLEQHPNDVMVRSKLADLQRDPRFAEPDEPDDIMPQVPDLSKFPVPPGLKKYIDATRIVAGASVPTSAACVAATFNFLAAEDIDVQSRAKAPHPSGVYFVVGSESGWRKSSAFRETMQGHVEAYERVHALYSDDDGTAEDGMESRAKLDFTHFKRHKRGNLQYDGTEWRGVSVHRSWRSIVKNPPTPTTSGYAQR